MAVRFLPPPGEPDAGAGVDRGDLAEVIELRGLLRQRAWAEPAAPAEAPETSGASAAPAESERITEVSEAAEISEAAEATKAADTTEAFVATEAAEVAAAPAAARSAVITALGDHLTRASELTRAGGLGPAAAAGRGAEPVRDADAEDVAMPVEALDAGEPEGAEDGLQAATDDGVRLLARRARSSGELREELLRLEHATLDVDAVIADFEERLYLDDAGLARAVTEKLRDTKRSSRSQIRMKLRERRLPDAVIEAALGELDDDEEFTLLREAAVARAGKLGGLDRAVAERRLLGFLARRGWSGEPASRAVREALDGVGGGSRRGRGSSGVRFE